MLAMFRPWLIRLPFLLALICVITVWVASYFGGFRLGATSAAGEWSIGAVQGLGFEYQDGVVALEDDTASVSGFTLGTKAKDWFDVITTLGFGRGKKAWFPKSSVIVFPLWLPTLMLAGLNWFVWRNTRPQFNGQGFPVDPIIEPTLYTK
jgi:hypothetical protein